MEKDILWMSGTKPVNKRYIFRRFCKVKLKYHEDDESNADQFYVVSQRLWTYTYRCEWAIQGAQTKSKGISYEQSQYQMSFLFDQKNTPETNFLNFLNDDYRTDLLLYPNMHHIRHNCLDQSTWLISQYN